MEIKNTTVMTKDFFIYFQRLTMRVSKINNIMRILISTFLIGLNAYLIYNSVYLFIVYRVATILPHTILVFVLTVLYFWLMIMSPSRIFKKHHLRNATMNFTFCEDKLIDETVNEGISSMQEVLYKNFKKIYETEKVILIYIDNIHVYAVNKEGFADESDIPCVRETLKAAVGDKKYIIKK